MLQLDIIAILQLIIRNVSILILHYQSVFYVLDHTEFNERNLFKRRYSNFLIFAPTLNTSLPLQILFVSMSPQGIPDCPQNQMTSNIAFIAMQFFRYSCLRLSINQSFANNLIRPIECNQI